MNNISAKNFVEFYGLVPFVLFALAGTYQYGYYFSFDALWILPHLSISSLLFSILTMVLLFTIGTVISIFYMTMSDMLGYLHSTVVLIVIYLVIVLLLFFSIPLELSSLLVFLSKGAILYVGFFYYITVHFCLTGNNWERVLAFSVTLIFTVGLFINILSSGAAKAQKVIDNHDNLPIVTLKNLQKTSYSSSDWRLLEMMDNHLIIINFEKKLKNRGYEIKLVEYKQVESIY